MSNSIEEKLSRINEGIKAKKEKESKKIEKEDLESVRLRIKNLEKTKSQLELILGSLELRSGNETGIGMREYSSKIERDFKDKGKKLDKLVVDYKEALETLGVKGKKDLLENPDFAEDREIADYKETKKQKEELALSDFDLRNKLRELGVQVQIGKEEFTYDLAKLALEEKIEDIKDQLAKERENTPEGKEELKKELSEYFHKKIPQFEFKHKKGDYFMTTDLKNTIFGSFSHEDWERIENRYPYEMIREVTQESLEKGVKEASIMKIGFKNGTEELEREFLPEAKRITNEILKESEYRHRAKKLGVEGYDIDHLGKLIKRTESDRRKAEFTIRTIDKIRNQYHEEDEIFISGRQINSTLARKKHERFVEETEEKRRELERVNLELEELRHNKPNLFRKQKWASKLDDLWKKKENLEEETDQYWTGKEEAKLKNNMFFELELPDQIEEKIKKGEIRAAGKPDEVFQELKEELSQIVNKKLSEEIIDFYNEFKDSMKR